MGGDIEKVYFYLIFLYNLILNFGIEIWLCIVLNILYNYKIYCVFDIYFFKKMNLMDEIG